MRAEAKQFLNDILSSDPLIPDEPLITPVDKYNIESYWVPVALTQQIIEQTCQCGTVIYATCNALVKQINTLRSTSIKWVDSRKLPSIDLLRLPRDVNYIKEKVSCCHYCITKTTNVTDSRQLELF